MESQSTDRSEYYYADGKKIPLVPDPRFYTVRFAPAKDSRDVSLSRKASRMLREDSMNVGFVPQYGIQIYEVTNDKISSRTVSSEKTSDVMRVVRELNDEQPVDFASVSYRRTTAPTKDQQPDLLFITREFVVQFKPDISPDEIEAFNTRYQVKVLEPLTYVSNGYVLIAPETSGELGTVSLSNTYYESGFVLFAHPNFIHKRHLRSFNGLDHASGQVAEWPESAVDRNTATERADFLSQQWHLNMAKVTDAWSVTRGKASIKIAILDDGVDTGHPEFAGKIVGQRDFATNQFDANPKNGSDNHGTACAGCATAKGVKAFGSAPDCSLLAVRTPEFLGVTEEADMFRWVADQGADIISCSWGPADGTGDFDPLPDNVRAAIRYCLTNGRGGKGIPIFWAAGNGDESVSLDGYASNPDVMAIAASTSRETRAWYSDMGPEIFICAPSSGDKNLNERRIFTTDRRGSSGYNPDSVSGVTHPASDLSYTDDFGGTSAATPLVAGIAGLMLSVNPNLTRNQVRDILQRTTDRIGQASDYDANGHSNLFGFGRVNALRAVLAAQTGGAAATATPSITGPVSMLSSDPPPVFQINKAGRALFAVEITTNPDLFITANSSQRSASTFYGSWQDTALMSGTSYQLPASVWANLKNSSPLFYRTHVANDNKWTDIAVSTPDSDVLHAPSFTISKAAIPASTTAPSITGPVSMRPSDPPPIFQINKAGRALFAVEITTNPDLFITANSSQRSASTFYGSWQDTALMSGTSYQLPASVWANLKNSSPLFYRTHVANDNKWTDIAVSTPDGQVSFAPRLTISNAGSSRIVKNDVDTTTSAIGDRNRKLDGLSVATRAMAILGPETYQAAAAPLSFQITLGNNQYYAIELAVDLPDLLNRQNQASRNADNFYASWQGEGLLQAIDSAVYTVPMSVWDRFRKASRIYYRVITSADTGVNWINYQISVPDSQAEEAPFVELVGSSGKRTELRAVRWLSPPDTRHPEEQLWRN